MGGLQLTDQGVCEVSTLPALRSLDLSCCKRVTDAGVAALRHHGSTRLTQLNLAGCTELTDAAAAAVGHLQHLTHLNLSGCREVRV
jgi:F-box/leucine-rich repeat protein 14